jgi:hypothetical protein
VVDLSRQRERDPYGQGCGRRKRNFAAAIGGFQVQGAVSALRGCLLQGPVHASVQVRCVVSPRGEDHNPGGALMRLRETCKR